MSDKDLRVERARAHKRRRAARRHDHDPPTPPDPRAELPLSQRKALVETLADGQVRTTYIDEPLSALALEAAPPEAPADDERPIIPLPLPLPPAAQNAEVEKAARWHRFGTHSGMEDDHR